MYVMMILGPWQNNKEERGSMWHFAVLQCGNHEFHRRHSIES